MSSNSGGVFGQGERPRVALYARVSTHDQQTLPLQIASMREYAERRHWDIAFEVEDIGSGGSHRPKRDEIVAAARRREIDLILVWKLDRWGRSLSDLVASFQELQALGVGFVSLTDALDFTTPSGRAMAGMLAVFAEFERDILRDRVKAGIADARMKGRPHGRPATARALKAEIQRLFYEEKRSKRSIARELRIGRASVVRILSSEKGGTHQ